MKSRKTIKGYTIIEIMIAVAIVGILAAVATPSYLNYQTRSKLAEAYAFLERAKLDVELYYTDKGETALRALRSNNFEARLELTKNVNTEIIRDYWIGPHTVNGTAHDITIWFRTKPDAPLIAALRNKWPFYLAGNINDDNGLIEWQCRSDYGNASLKKYVPTKCRKD